MSSSVCVPILGMRPNFNPSSALTKCRLFSISFSGSLANLLFIPVVNNSFVGVSVRLNSIIDTCCSTFSNIHLGRSPNELTNILSHPFVRTWCKAETASDAVILSGTMKIPSPFLFSKLKPNSKNSTYESREPFCFPLIVCADLYKLFKISFFELSIFAP